MPLDTAFILMMLSNLQNAFQTLFYVKHTTCLWGSSSGYFIVRKIAVQRNEAPVLELRLTPLSSVPHPGPFAPHSAVPAESGHLTHGSRGSVDTAELHRCPPRSHSDLGGTSALNMAPTRSMLLYKPFPPHSAGRGRALRCCCKRASFQQLTFFYSKVAGSHQGFAQPELCWPEKGCERGQWTENREASRICVERDIHQPPDWLCFWSHFIL